MMTKELGRNEKDDVVDCLKSMNEKLEHLAPILSNGNVEKELKIFLGAAWFNSDQNTRTCVMDKKFNGAPIDLFALSWSNGAMEPAFWVETKCTFITESTNYHLKTAVDALSKVWDYAQKIKKELWSKKNELEKKKTNSPKKFELFEKQINELDYFREVLLTKPVYIVHFLNSIPDDSHRLPKFLSDKFPINEAKSEEVSKLLQREYAPMEGEQAQLETFQQCVGFSEQERQLKLEMKNEGDKNVKKRLGKARDKKKTLSSALAKRHFEGSAIVKILPGIDALVVKFRPTIMQDLG